MLADCGVDLSPQELLDALWLAQRLPSDASAPLARALAAAEPAPVTGASEAAARVPSAMRELAAEQEAPPDQDLSPGALHASAARTPSSEAVRNAPLAALAVRAPEEKALGAVELRLGRALRPLKQRHPGGRLMELDERATADAMAETGLPDLVLRPAGERRLDLALIVDDGLSMLLWRRLAAETRSLLERLGAFRSVRVHGLDTRGPGEPALRGRPFAARAAGLSPGSVADPTGRTLVLVVSDGVGAAWRDGRMRRVLERWAVCGPTAVLHALPARMWNTSGIRTEDWEVSVHQTWAANRTWQVADPVLPPELAPFDGMPIPVLEPEPGSVGRWARLVASAGGSEMLPLLADAPQETPRPAVPSRNGGDPVLRFRSAASPEAYRLAAHLAAVAPVSVPVMRLVQSAVPWRAETAHLAEVFLGGLMRRTDGGGSGTGPQHQTFDFTEESRKILLDTVPAGELARTNSAVADRLGELVGRSPDFPAWLAHPGGTDQVTGASQPFAELDARLMRHLGAPVGRPAPRQRAWGPLGPEDPRSLGPYELYARSEASGFAVLYLGRDGYGREALLRVPRSADPEDAHHLTQRVALALTRMGGRYAPALRDHNSVEPPFWTAEELLVAATGEPAPQLPAFVRQKDPSPGSALCYELSWSLAQAVSRCHGQGMAHGALTPASVLVTGHASVRLTGWSRALVHPPTHELGVATASDVYSLGTLLIALNSRSMPWSLEEGELRGSSSWLPRVPHPELRKVLSRCLALDPRTRPSAGEVADAFAALLQGGAGRWSPPLDVADDDSAEDLVVDEAPAPVVEAPSPSARLWVPQRRTAWGRQMQERQLELIQRPLARCHRIVVASTLRFAGASTTAHALGALLASVRQNSRVVLITNDRKWFAGSDASGLRIPRIERNPGGPLSTPRSYRGLVNSLRDECDVLITDTDADMPLPSGHLTDSLVDQLVVVAAPSSKRGAVVDATEALFDQVTQTASDRLVARSIAVISQHHGSAGAQRDLSDRLRGRCRGLVSIPSDGGLAGGRFPDPALLRPATRERYLDLAALVAEGFPPVDGR
ncbi:SAV_2336 N-terminal domain-related protein [Streptomyces silvisoli]|uniref:SAV_2336 N-terminal domain-related protein n=1 Tax=Streptomyces silvisoli TaxID=3034235 RepID=A0ABT5ZSJ2_9ACTN|nr:SAV_2336 N-terminal domain-related protein [Streptomyces silvisoli]MDF3292555.1 SAV_2336 N-terminal domain-related protein [Streptomyces silvisoli]